MTKFERIEAFFGCGTSLSPREFWDAWPRRLLLCVILMAVGAAIGALA